MGCFLAGGCPVLLWPQHWSPRGSGDRPVLPHWWVPSSFVLRNIVCLAGRSASSWGKVSGSQAGREAWLAWPAIWWVGLPSELQGLMSAVCRVGAGWHPWCTLALIWALQPQEGQGYGSTSHPPEWIVGTVMMDPWVPICGTSSCKVGQGHSGQDRASRASQSSAKMEAAQAPTQRPWLLHDVGASALPMWRVEGVLQDQS